MEYHIYRNIWNEEIRIILDWMSLYALDYVINLLIEFIFIVFTINNTTVLIWYKVDLLIT